MHIADIIKELFAANEELDRLDSLSRDERMIQHDAIDYARMRLHAAKTDFDEYIVNLATNCEDLNQ